ncbi:MAG: hypothetical protein AAGF12_30765 [Myxococcota bacterium]
MEAFHAGMGEDEVLRRGLVRRLQEIAALREDLRRKTAEAFDTAFSVAEGAGVSPEWAAVCQRYGVMLVSDEERLQIRAAQRPERGAAVLEFSQVVEELVRSVRIPLKKIDNFDCPNQVEVEYDKLMNLLRQVKDELVTAYRGAVLPQRKGMFGNVMMHHDPSKSPKLGGTAHALRCRNCGAPRLNKTDFICAFCGAQMV